MVNSGNVGVDLKNSYRKSGILDHGELYETVCWLMTQWSIQEMAMSSQNWKYFGIWNCNSWHLVPMIMFGILSFHVIACGFSHLCEKLLRLLEWYFYRQCVLPDAQLTMSNQWKYTSIVLRQFTIVCLHQYCILLQCASVWWYFLGRSCWRQ